MREKEKPRSIRSRIRGGVRKCFLCRTPPRLAFVAIAAFIERSAAPPARSGGAGRRRPMCFRYFGQLCLSKEGWAAPI